MGTKTQSVVLTLGIVGVCALVFSDDVGAQSAPKRKPGLWQQNMTSSGSQVPPMSMTMCTDEKTDDMLSSKASGAQQCSQPTSRREGNAYVFEAVCKDGATTVKARGTFTGDFTNQYSGEIRYTFDPPQRGMKEMTQKMEARWLGACKPGQKPGDVVVDGMGGMNINQMMGGDPKHMQEMMNDPKKMREMQEMMEKMMQQQKTR
jgi:hypothetical protein